MTKANGQRKGAARAQGSMSNKRQRRWSAQPKGKYSDSVLNITLTGLSDEIIEGFNDEYDKLKIELGQEGLSPRDLLSHALKDTVRGKSAISFVIYALTGGAIDILRYGEGVPVKEDVT